MKAVLALLLALPLQTLASDAPPGKLHAPGRFDELVLSGNAVVRYQQGERDELFVQGDEEALAHVQVELEGTRLTVRNSGSWRFWSSRRLHVQVMSRELKRLSVSGAADVVAVEPVQAGELLLSISGSGLVRFPQLKAERVRFSVSGSGDGELGGSTQQLEVSISGRGELRAEPLQAQKVRISVSGIGTVKTWAVQELEMAVSGVGTVEYWGNPSVQRRSSGISRVNAMGTK
jgi:Putative auto-transporter adhesin, head GIN domain